MFTRTIQFFYPDIKENEVKKFSLLALAFFFTVGTYWLMRLLKDLVLYKLAFPATLGWSNDTGRLWIPFVKTISPIFVFGLVIIYNKLVDLFEKHKLIYVVVSFYMVFFSGLTVLAYVKNLYGEAFLGKTILATSGILGYLFTESFGSLVVTLFWSFTISSSNSDQAKRTFPFIVAIGQLGSIIGSSLMLIKTTIIWPLYAIVVLCLGCLILTIKYLVKTVPEVGTTQTSEKKKSTDSILDGFKLLLTKPYLVGVFIVSTFYEVAITIVEYHMNSQASITFNDATFQWFKGVYGVSINIIAFSMALLGTSHIIKKLGVRICLLIYPVSFAFAVIALYGYYLHAPSAIQLLWATFGVMIFIKANSYAVNNPVKEMMYIPTSKNVKFKTKSIIDMFGARSAKMSGAQVCKALNVPNNAILSIKNLMLYGSLVSLGVIGIWIIAAIYVGNRNKQLIDENSIIE